MLSVYSTARADWVNYFEESSFSGVGYKVLGVILNIYMHSEKKEYCFVRLSQFYEGVGTQKLRFMCVPSAFSFCGALDTKW